MKSLLLIVLMFFFVGLSYRFIYGNGGLIEVRNLKKKLNQQEEMLAKMDKANAKLAEEIEYLKKDFNYIEELARHDLGMIKKGETYYQVVEPVN